MSAQEQKKVFVKRNEAHLITAISLLPAEGFPEALAVDHPDIVQFLNDSGGAAKEKTRLLESDLQLIRVLEDLIELLIKKNMINLTELPWAAQEKLLQRRNIRDELGDILGLENNPDFKNIDEI